MAAKILAGDVSACRGALVEKRVASALWSAGIQPYYYHAPGGSSEIDFVYSANGEPAMVECKATNKRMTSMKHVIAHTEKYESHPAVKFADANVGKATGSSVRSHYALGFPPQANEPLVVTPPDFSGFMSETN